MKFSEFVKSCQEPNQKITAPILADAVSEVVEKQKDRVKNALVRELQAFQSTIEANVSQLRALRKQEKAISVNLKLLTAALDQFGKDGNPFPVYLAMFPQNKNLAQMRAAEFCRLSGLEVPDLSDPVWFD